MAESTPAEKKGNRNQYVSVSFALLDSGLTGVVGASAMLVHMAMQRHIWRTTKSGPQHLRDAYRLGNDQTRNLVMNASVGTLAKDLGCDRRKVQAGIDRLLTLRLIRVWREAAGSEPASYYLGWKDNTSGTEFMQTEWIAKQAMDEITEYAAQHEMKVLDVPWAARKALVEELIVENAVEGIEDAKEATTIRENALALLTQKPKPRGNPKWDRHADWADEPSPWSKR